MPNDFLESDLEDIIYRNRRVITKYGLPPFKSVAFKQVYLPSGRKIDILAFEVVNGHLSMDVYELKRDCIDAAAVCQAYNYLEEIRQLIGNSFCGTDIRVMLIGRKTSMTSHIEKTCLPIEVYGYTYELNGIVFTKLNSSTLKHQESVSFTRGVAVFGTGELSFRQDPESISLHSEYDLVPNKHPEVHKELVEIMKQWRPGVKIIKEVEKEYITTKPTRQYVETIHFPENPSWTKEFEKALWEIDLPCLEDIFPTENEDLEPEHLEEDADTEDPGFDEETLQPEWIEEERLAKIIQMQQTVFETAETIDEYIDQINN